MQSLLKNQTELFIEHGVNYCKYVPVKPLDNLELISSSKLVNFYYKDQSAFINTSRVFLEVEYLCQNNDGTAITQADAISANNVMSQSLIDTCVLNIGEFFVAGKATYENRWIGRSVSLYVLPLHFRRMYAQSTRCWLLSIAGSVQLPHQIHKSG